MDRSCEDCKHFTPSTERNLSAREKKDNAKCAVSGKPPLYCVSERERFGQCGPAGKKWEAAEPGVVRVDGAPTWIDQYPGAEFRSFDYSKGVFKPRFFVGGQPPVPPAPPTHPQDDTAHANGAGLVIDKTWRDTWNAQQQVRDDIIHEHLRNARCRGSAPPPHTPDGTTLITPAQEALLRERAAAHANEPGLLNSSFDPPVMTKAGELARQHVVAGACKKAAAAQHAKAGEPPPDADVITDANYTPWHFQRPSPPAGEPGWNLKREILPLPTNKA